MHQNVSSEFTCRTISKNKRDYYIVREFLRFKTTSQQLFKIYNYSKSKLNY